MKDVNLAMSSEDKRLAELKKQLEEKQAEKEKSPE